MKILMVATEFPPIIGGGGRYVENLIIGLSKKGIKVKLLTSGDIDQTIKVNTNLEIKRYKLFKDIYFGRGNFVDGVNQIVEEIKIEKPDIIHTHHSVESVMVQAANTNFSIPHVITHHKTPGYLKNLDMLNGKWSVFKFTNIVNSKNVFIAPSITFTKSLINSGVNSRKIFQIYPGVDRSVYRKLNDNKDTEKLRKRLGIDEDNILILLPTQVRQRKGIKFALEALSKISIGSKKINVLVTGLPSLEDREKKILVEKLLPNKLINLDKTFEDEEMAILYNIANVVLLPSEAEGLGICLLEAMACETPIIATDVVGINEVIMDRVNGRLVKFGDHKSLAKAIIDLLLNEKLRQSCIKNGLLVLEQKFNLELQAKEHLKVYKSLCQKKIVEGQVLNTEGIQKILYSTLSYRKILDNKKTVACIIIGSIPEGKYIPGWSDIDMICLSDSPDLKYFDDITILETEIKTLTGVKTGIEVVDDKNLRAASADAELAENFIKYIKNFYNRMDKQKILFVTKDFLLPIFDKKLVAAVSISGHALQTLGYMYKYLKMDNISNKEVMRKIIKNTLFLMQSNLLVKHGIFIDDYGKVIKSYATFNRELNYSVLNKYFKLRYFWGKMSEEDVTKTDILLCWKLFQEIADKNILS